MIKRTIPVFFLLTLSLFLLSWGSVGHKIISGHSVSSFPTTMTGFQTWSDSLASNASNADSRKNSDSNESPKHFIDIDNYSEFNTTGRIASTYDSVVIKHGATFVLKNGTLPWATSNMFDTLVIDFKKLKWHKAMLDASDLGHYVADGHMPLHITANYDGGSTNQSGIHSRYESDMVYAFQTALSNYTGTPATYISNVDKFVYSYIYKNHIYVDSVLAADSYAVKVDAAYGTAYSGALWSKTQFTNLLFRTASHSIADLIYSAWMDAGSPRFGTLTAINSVTKSNLSVNFNPKTGDIHLSGDDILKTEVFNTSGQKMSTFTGNILNIGKLSNGIYVLNIDTKNGFCFKQKVLLIR